VAKRSRDPGRGGDSYWAIPAAPRSGRLAVELRSPIFGFAISDRLLAGQALDVE
jgi:hypothetical protein